MTPHIHADIRADRKYEAVFRLGQYPAAFKISKRVLHTSLTNLLDDEMTLVLSLMRTYIVKL